VATPQYYTIYLMSTVSAQAGVGAGGGHHSHLPPPPPPPHPVQNPDSMRYHLLNANPDDGMVIAMWYQRPQKLVVYVNGVQVEDMNWSNGRHRSTLPGGTTYVEQFPTPASPTGTNAYYRLSRTIHFTVRGSTVVEVKQLPVIQVSLTLAISVEQFYNDQTNFVNNMAFVLNIPANRIRVVNVVPGSAAIDFQVLPPTNLIPASSGGAAPETLNTPAVHASLTTLTQQIVTAAVSGALQTQLGTAFPIEQLQMQAPPPPAPVVNVTAGVNATNPAPTVAEPPAVTLGKGTFQFQSAVVSVSETATTVRITVARVNGTFTAVAVSYATFLVNATWDDAVGGAETSTFTAAAGTLQFAAGQTNASFTVTLAGADNGRFSFPAPRIGLRLSNPTNGAALAAVGSVGFIELVDASAAVTVDASNAPDIAPMDTLGGATAAAPKCFASNADAAVTVNLARTGSLAQPARVSLRLASPGAAATTSMMATAGGVSAVPGVDFDGATYSVTFAAGQATAQVTLPLLKTMTTQVRFGEVVVTGTRDVVPTGGLAAGLPICITASATAGAAAATVAVPPQTVIGAAVGGSLAFVLIVSVAVWLARSRSRSSAATGDKAPLSAKSSRKLASVTPIAAGESDQFAMSNPMSARAAAASAAARSPSSKGNGGRFDFRPTVAGTAAHHNPAAGSRRASRTVVAGAMDGVESGFVNPMTVGSPTAAGSVASGAVATGVSRRASNPAVAPVAPLLGAAAGLGGSRKRMSTAAAGARV
jgi:hypothetical protein